MRRALLKRWPALSRFYPGLLPEHADHMTLRELSEYVVQMDTYCANNPGGDQI